GFDADINVTHRSHILAAEVPRLGAFFSSTGRVDERSRLFGVYRGLRAGHAAGGDVADAGTQIARQRAAGLRDRGGLPRRAVFRGRTPVAGRRRHAAAAGVPGPAVRAVAL